MAVRACIGFTISVLVIFLQAKESTASDDFQRPENEFGTGDSLGKTYLQKWRDVVHKRNLMGVDGGFGSWNPSRNKFINWRAVLGGASKRGLMDGQVMFGQDSLKLPGFQDWRNSKRGFEDDQAMFGQDSLKLPGFQDWRSSKRGFEDGQALFGQDSLKLPGFQDWRSSKRGFEDGQTMFGQDSMKLLGFQDWRNRKRGFEDDNAVFGQDLLKTGLQNWRKSKKGFEHGQSVFGQDSLKPGFQNWRNSLVKRSSKSEQDTISEEQAPAGH